MERCDWSDACGFAVSDSAGVSGTVASLNGCAGMPLAAVQRAAPRDCLVKPSSLMRCWPATDCVVELDCAADPAACAPADEASARKLNKSSPTHPRSAGTPFHSLTVPPTRRVG
jgi:hypothetical protein